MATLEQFVLDGLALNDSTNFRIQDADPGIPQKRWQWISGTDSDGAVLPEEAHYDNAEMTLRIRVAPQTTMDLALAKIGQIVDKLQECEQQADQGGLAMVWTPAGSTKTLTAYILGGEITGIPMTLSGDDAGWFLRNPAPVVTIKLYRRPGLVGTEVTSAATVTNSLPYQVLTVANVTGDLSAEARLVVTDAATQSRRSLRWGIRWRYYDAATSLLVDSDDMVTSGFAGTQTTRSGSYDPNASGNNVIRATLITNPTAVCGVGNLGHVGSYRVVLRCYAVPTASSKASDFKVRATWKEGDGPLRSNGWASPVVVNGFSEVDLGIVTIPPKTLGTQRWTGQIDAYSAAAGDTIDVDYCLLFPVDAYGRARAVYSYAPGAVVGRDEFTGIAASTALNARVAPVGGTWATSGATTDFVAADAPNGTDETETRATISDSGAGRFAILGSTNYTDVEVGVRLRTTAYAGTNLGVVARWTDSSNYVRAYVDATTQTLEMTQLVAGSGSGPTGVPILPSDIRNAWFTIRLMVFASGRAIAQLLDASGNTVASLDWTHSALATGGTLATGKPGFVDGNTVTTAATRYYDNFYVATPSPEPVVIYSGRSAEINSQKAQRQDSSGTYYGDMPGYRVARFLLWPAGDENRTNQVLVTARRTDTDLAVDDQIADSTTVTIHYTPRWSVLPR